MDAFIMFYAPFIVVIIGIVLAFLWAPMDRQVTKEKK
ncbi:cytochrome bd oxidase small subunit CydS [Lysinibacillus sp. 54212]